MINFERVLEYLNSAGISYTVDTNPTPEKVERIKKQIKKNLDLQNQIRILQHKRNIITIVIENILSQI